MWIMVALVLVGACAPDKRRIHLVEAPAAGTATAASTPTPTPTPTTPPPGFITRLGPLMAGVAAVDITPPVGVPLGGFGGGARRLGLPDFNPFNYHTFLAPSTGVRDPIMAKALMLSDGVDKVCLVSLDAVATSAMTVGEVLAKVQQAGVALARDRLLVSASHTHSGPGTLSEKRAWELIAMDLFQRRVFDAATSGIARAVIEADLNMGPARFGSTSTSQIGLTKNRRANESPKLDEDSIDPEVGVLRFDRADGSPLAVVYNYAVHPIAYGASDMEFSADLVGSTSRVIEQRVPGATAIFVNGAEGDISPRQKGVAGATLFGDTLGRTVVDALATITTTDQVEVEIHSHEVDFGKGQIFLGASALPTLGPLNFGALFGALGFQPGLTLPLDDTWVETRFWFGALRLNRTVLATVPGEPIRDLGLSIKDEGRRLGFDRTWCAALTNGHMAYITTPEEFRYGGYEALATMYGADTGARVFDAAAKALAGVKP
ncbi:MAG: neutral/alkaline non-lysosomal ceramidase N-terminal domain-containing protein [Planctomycetes bacterium]|nr:neutral/alkaline non-lysosomal ceramidase N-terminal domain-containing protein [Planctomycetota bacterium]